ncbi:MAG: aconitase X [Atribacterota bacterium]|nr:aconitase X [Atribacterota bacterium]
MELTKEEEKILAGTYGESYKKAMEILVKMGEYSSAEHMVPISWADLTTFSGRWGGHGDSPDNDLYHFLREFEDLCLKENAKFKCPMTIVDVSKDEQRNERMKKLGAKLVAPAGASSPHDLFPWPLFGQYASPGATNGTTFFNSMLGVRANSEGPIGVHMAALTGRTPEYGYLLDENRLGKVLVEVKTELNNYIDWAVLGFYISRTLSTLYWDIPVLTGIDPISITSDDVMSFCASMNHPGSLGHFLIEGVSPEAPTLDKAFGGKEPKEKFVVGPAEMKEIYDLYAPSGNKPDIVTVRFPLTVERLYEVVHLLEGKKIHHDVSFAVNLTVHARTVVERFGLREKLESAGVLMGDTQGQVMWNGEIIDPWVDSRRVGIKTMITDSLKDCNGARNQDIEVALLPSLEKIIKTAINGRVEV